VSRFELTTSGNGIDHNLPISRSALSQVPFGPEPSCSPSILGFESRNVSGWKWLDVVRIFVFPFTMLKQSVGHCSNKCPPPQMRPWCSKYRCPCGHRPIVETVPQGTHGWTHGWIAIWEWFKNGLPTCLWNWFGHFQWLLLKNLILGVKGFEPRPVEASNFQPSVFSGRYVHQCWLMFKVCRKDSSQTTKFRTKADKVRVF
jgi:hypothetical protein